MRAEGMTSPTMNGSVSCGRSLACLPRMADRRDLEFTYSLIDRIFRLSLGELADFSGAKYDGDFSLTLEEAQRRKHEYVAEQIGIGPGRRCSTSAAAGDRCSTSSARARGQRRRRDALLRAGRGLPAPRARRPPARRAAGRPRDVRAVRRGRQPRRLRAFLLARGLPRRAARSRSTATCSPTIAELLPDRRPPVPADDGLRAQHDPTDEVSIDAPRDSDDGTGADDAPVPGLVPALRLRAGRRAAPSPTSGSSSASSGRLDYIETIKQWRERFAEPSLRKTLLKARLVPRWLTSATSGWPSRRASAPTASASSASCSTTSGWSSRRSEGATRRRART